MKIHSINPEIVKEQINKKLSQYHRIQNDKSLTTTSFSRMIQQEVNHYSRAYIKEDEKGFRLCYKKNEKGGTGPFETYNKAVAWFANGGR
jgi:flagellar hook-basal body complex protein FliE